MSTARPLRRWHLTIQCPNCHEYQEPIAIVTEEIMPPMLPDEQERGEFKVALLQGARTFTCQNINCRTYGKPINTRTTEFKGDGIGYGPNVSPALRELK